MVRPSLLLQLCSSYVSHTTSDDLRGALLEADIASRFACNFGDDDERVRLSSLAVVCQFAKLGMWSCPIKFIDLIFP